jgi:p-cumate 2,3-dioxygenase beta subunit
VSTSTEVQLPTRSDVEDFLYLEAELLDAWKLEEWLTLFEEGATYEVPATDTPDGDHRTSLFLVADNWTRLQARVKRLLSKNAHVENPRSRTRRMITNVRLVPGEEPGGPGESPEVAATVRVRASFVVYRTRYEIVDTYIGSYDHVLVCSDTHLRFRHRKAVLDLEALRPSGKVSIIL